MNNNFTTVDQYIALADQKQQALLQQVRTIIAHAVPDATETISYQMPTFRYHGNLIHFALFKNHLGLYPGPEAIIQFQKDLIPYKTTKGAIQIPFDKELPVELIEKIVRFNFEKLRHKSAPDWRRHQGKWTEAIDKIEQIIHELPLTKTIKWGSDVYTFNNKNIVSYGGFKNHFAIWFYNGVFLNDKAGVLVTAYEGKTKALRQWRFSHAGEMDPVRIKAYIEEAIQTVKDGKEIKPDKSIVKPVEGFIKTALDNDPDLREAFHKLTPGRRKEYITYLDEAKQEKTKQTRLEKIIPMIFAGTGLHDKYKR